MFRKEQDKRCELGSHTTGGGSLGLDLDNMATGNLWFHKMHRIPLPSVCPSASQEQQTGQYTHTWTALLLRSLKVPSSNLSRERL